VSDHDEHADDLEAAPRRADGYQPLSVDPDHPARHAHGSNNTHAHRMLFPFLLLVAVALLLVIRLVYYRTRADPEPPTAGLCPGTSKMGQVEAGDTCWKLSQARNSTLEEFMNVNPEIDCNHLLPGQSVCLPRSEGCMD